MRLYFAFLFLCINFIIVNPSFSSPTDTDSDGLSNFLTIREGGSELRWVSYDSDGESFNFADSFGVSSDIMAPGDYTTAGFMPAIINTNYVWNFANGKDIEFGSNEPLFISGGDYDGDGISDLAYATNACINKRTNFKILSNPLSNNKTEHSMRMKARGNNYKLFFDINLDGKDDLCSITSLVNRKRNAESGKFRILCKDINNVRAGSFNIGRIYSQPRVIYLNNTPHLVLIRERKNRTIIRIRNTSGQVVHRETIPLTGDILIGNYTNSNNQVIAVIKDEVAGLYNPITDSLLSVEFPRGTPIDSFNAESFSSDQSCFCNTKTVNKFGGCGGDSGNNPIEEDPNDNQPSEYFVPDNCSNPPSNISAHDGFKCMGSATRGGSIVCLLPYQFTWAPHKMVTDHHNYSFACNRDDASFDNVKVFLNDNSVIDLTYAGCHNYVATQDGWVGRQHFRNEGVNWNSIKSRATRIEMKKGNKKTCLSL